MAAAVHGVGLHRRLQLAGRPFCLPVLQSRRLRRLPLPHLPPRRCPPPRRSHRRSPSFCFCLAEPGVYSSYDGGGTCWVGVPQEISGVGRNTGRGGGGFGMHGLPVDCTGIPQSMFSLSLPSLHQLSRLGQLHRAPLREAVVPQTFPC